MDRRLLIFAGLALAAPASAQYGYQEDRPGIGVRAGLFLPSDSFIRDTFGKSILNFGIGGGSARRPSQGSITPEIDFLNADRGGSRLFIGSLAFGYEYHFNSDDQATTVPYGRLFGGVSYFDYGINTTSGRTSGKRLGANYGAELGLVLAGRFRVAARYTVFGEQDGFNFNGINLIASANLFRF